VLTTEVTKVHFTKVYEGNALTNFRALLNRGSGVAVKYVKPYNDQANVSTS